MSSIVSTKSLVPPEPTIPDWLADLLGIGAVQEGEVIDVRGCKLTLMSGILRAQDVVSSAQAQTGTTFGFKWAKRDTFEGELVRQIRDWLILKYGNVSEAEWPNDHGERPLMLDAGCGAAVSALAF